RNANRDGDDGVFACQLRFADLDPALIAGRPAVDDLAFWRGDLDAGLQGLPDRALQVERLDGEIDLGRLGDAERLEKLLNRAHARHGRTLHRIGPAIA